MNPPQPGNIPAQWGNPPGAGPLSPGGTAAARKTSPEPEKLDLMADPDMLPPEVVEMGKPIEERNLVEHALEYNPHRKTLEVFLMLGMLTSFLGVVVYAALSYALVETFFSTGAASHLHESQYDICDDEGCEEYEHRTMGFVDWRSNPCDSYFLYACSGFQKEAVDLNLAIYESHLDFTTSEYQLLASLLQKGVETKAAYAALLLNVRDLYAQCRTSDEYHFAVIEYLEGEIMTRKSGQSGPEEPSTLFSNIGYPLGETFVFEVVKEKDGTCYLYPPTMFFPNAMFQSSEFKSNFIKAFEDYYDNAFQPRNNMFRYDLVDFFIFQKRLAELMGDPKRQIFRPVDVNSPEEGLEKLVDPGAKQSLECDGRIVWTDSEYYTGLETLINETSKLVLVNMIRFRVILRFSLFGQRATSLAQLYYRYTHFMNEPPHVEIRCLDAMEYVWRPYYMDLLRRTHVYQHGDIDPKVANQSEKALEKLIGQVSSALERSVLDEEDVAEAKRKLREIKFRLFYPWKLADREVSEEVKKLSVNSFSAKGDVLSRWKNVLSQRRLQRIGELASWPLHTFAHDPLYVPHQNTLYVPYSVFVWAYMDKKSKLPFNLPVYGFKVIRELFKVFDYRSQWWVNKRTMSILRYEKVEQCVQKLDALYDIQNGVESYETIAEIAAANLLLEIFVDTVNYNKQKHEDIRLPFLRSVPSTTQFFVALASELCARTDGTTARLLNSDYGAKTAEQRFTILARHMPRFTKHFGCTPKQRMHLAKNYHDCLFWRR
ncbi:membrane metallo-endopeptidase-like 1 [Dermacentor albipictus]|uniref:membrane metallo-endopeptidase-like 1 n=1 Tax=Dermacentor albipictus TaxID=60249 RepID=UPI0031FD237B